MPNTHSKFPPSSADRHLNCTPSLVLESAFPNVSNDAAKEGTYAHWMCENKLLSLLKMPLNDEEPEWNPEWDREEMDKASDDYIDFIRVRAVEESAVKIIPESTVSFDNWVEGGFGTSDCVILGAETISIIDFKYGRVKVNHVNNTQLKIYALGVYQTFGQDYPMTAKIKMSIFQPRCAQASTYEMTLGELINWAVTYVKPRAEAALKGTGDFVEGSWCTYCKAKATCPKKFQATMDLLEDLGKPAEGLTNDQLAKLLPHLKDICDYCDALMEYAVDKAEQGHQWPGMKLVPGAARRVFNNEGDVVNAAKANNISTGNLFKSTLLTPAQLEKAVGKETYVKVFKPVETVKNNKSSLKPI